MLIILSTYETEPLGNERSPARLNDRTGGSREISRSTGGPEMSRTGDLVILVRLARWRRAKADGVTEA